MEAYQKIQLAFKCPKAFDELQPCESNWYCDGCRKMVYDFRGMEEAQILEAFAQSGKKLCGIYDAGRINVLPQQPRWYRWATTAVMALGVMLMNSCGFGHEQKTITLPGVLLPPPPPIKVDTLLAPPKTKPIKAKIPTLVIRRDMNIALRTDSATEEAPVMGISTEIQPSFPGGEAAWAKYINEHLNYKGNFTGRVFVQFIVEKDGQLTEIKIAHGGDSVVNTRIIRLIERSPKWRPGIQNSKPYRTQYTVPFNFPAVKTDD